MASEAFPFQPAASVARPGPPSAIGGLDPRADGEEHASLLCRGDRPIGTRPSRWRRRGRGWARCLPRSIAAKGKLSNVERRTRRVDVLVADVADQLEADRRPDRQTRLGPVHFRFCPSPRMTPICSSREIKSITGRLPRIAIGSSQQR